MSEPTHILKTLTGFYYVDLASDPADLKLLQDLIGTTNGSVKVTYMVEDNSKYDQKQYIDKVAIISCRALVSIEEV